VGDVCTVGGSSGAAGLGWVVCWVNDWSEFFVAAMLVAVAVAVAVAVPLLVVAWGWLPCSEGDGCDEWIFAWPALAISG